MSKLFVVGPRGGIAVDDGGSGRALPFVLVHGATGRAEHWAGVLARLRPSRRALALDLPGHGLSDPPKDVDWSTEAMAEALHLAVEELELPRFVLAGHSLAGSIVAEYAAAHPRRVAALALLDTGRRVPSAGDLEELRAGFRAEAYDAFTARWFEEMLAGATSATRDEVLRGLRAMPRANFMALVYGGLGHDMAAAAARYPGPKLALCAEGSGMAERWEGAPGVAVKSLAGVSHWLHLDAPEEVARALEELAARAR
jgi:pimeloyl-ACP methyl ester carboxylesterase